MSKRALITIATAVMVVATGCGARRRPPRRASSRASAPASAGTSTAPSAAASSSSGQIDLVQVALSSNVNNWDNCKNQAAPDAQSMGLFAGYCCAGTRTATWCRSSHSRSIRRRTG